MAAHRTAYERHAPHPRVVERALAGSEQSVFWLDDVAATSYPELTASTRADLTIVGGGYLGLWAAVHAKRRDPGRRVVLLEAHTIGWAASGRNGGFCEASLTHGEDNGRNRWPDEYDVLARLGHENLAGFEADVRDLGIDCEWERTGTLSVAVEEHQVGWLRDEPHFLDAAQVRAEIDSPLFLAGAMEPDDTALVHPAKLALELARVAADLGVEVHEHSAATALRRTTAGVEVHTDRAVVTSDHVVLATNVFPSLLRRNRLMTVPVYDYVLMTEPLTSDQLASIGWAGRQGLGDVANQFHYSRLSADNRILWGGYDAVYPAGGRVAARHEDRPASYSRLASHFLATFPQLEDVRFTHRWAGAIDTCTQFTAFYGLSHDDRVAHAAGFTGLGVGATRFAAEVLLDLLSGATTERTDLRMVRERPLPFPPEPLASVGINLTRWSLDRADHRRGRRNVFLRALDAAGLGFDS
ncbi:FAD-dependent oxidoreductase [Nocardioides glacieisoli]|uniref:FAD-dependent oxidoreductase n=1 Tax=Nocardioides glacieisoli TaxID=1168730 RepID=A0A4Q2RMY8_9ACTN|nr:FAD-dependent oxidoreductase [Nocardioides glacieisoli]RYB90231.1 FAD-dependent oxidoreductase [Nocardioides glacieisoli]